jgi:2-methylcitrate dehydratase PrpD
VTPGAALLEFAARTRFDDLPEPVREVARLAVLDWWGVTVAGAAEPVARRLGEALTEARGPASVLGTGRRVSPVTAALLNGTASHALDYDDTHVDLPGHLTAPILPGLVALAETRRSSGPTVLAAFAVGAELMCRLARVLGRGHYRQGWHATATLGRLGAALAAARLAGLGPAALDQALGLAAAQLGGIQESFGTMAKPFQVGRAAADGLLAALSAERGVTASAGLLDQEDWARRLAPEWRPEALVDRLGEEWRFTEVFFKRYPCCFAIHAVIRALLSIAPRPAPATIESVDLEVGPTTLQVANQVAPRTGLGGKFSVTHCEALALVRGHVTEADFDDAAMADATVQALAARVRLHARSDLDETRARVVVHLLDGGGTREAGGDLRRDANPGAIRRDLVRKLRELVDGRLGRRSGAALEARLIRIDQEPDLGKLARLSAVRVSRPRDRASRPRSVPSDRRAGARRRDLAAGPGAPRARRLTSTSGSGRASAGGPGTPRSPVPAPRRGRSGDPDRAGRPAR